MGYMINEIQTCHGGNSHFSKAKNNSCKTKQLKLEMQELGATPALTAQYIQNVLINIHDFIHK